MISKNTCSLLFVFLSFFVPIHRVVGESVQINFRNLSNGEDFFGQPTRRLDYEPLGLQSGPDTGHTTAGAIVMHQGDIWVVGRTEGDFFHPRNFNTSLSGCFLTHVKLASSTSDSDRGWSLRITFSNPEVDEECTSLHWASKNRVILTGRAEPGGLLKASHNATGNTAVDEFGMLLDVQVGSEGNATLLGGHLLNQSIASYPISMVFDSLEPPNLYVLSMETDKSVLGDENEGKIGSSLSFYNMNDPRNFFEYKMLFNMTVTKLTPLDPAALALTESAYGRSMTELWRQPFSPEPMESVHTAAIGKIRSQSREMLVVAGTTKGHGAVFGELSGGSTDLDGFVARISMRNEESESSNLSTRIRSIEGVDDWISNICVHESFVYVVGSTRGTMPHSSFSNEEGIDAFLIKLDGITMQTVWTFQLGALPLRSFGVSDPASVTGVACVVTHDGDAVYMAGVVETDAVLNVSGSIFSYGDDDVFIVQLDAQNGSINYARQFGSEGKDVVAFRHGLGVDEDGNAIVVGSTFGSFYRQRDPKEVTYSDIFVASVSKSNGDLVIPLAQPRLYKGPTSSPNSSATDFSTGQKAAIGFAVFLVFVATILLGMHCNGLHYGGTLSTTSVETDRSKIISYVSRFDVEAVDLNHSATGGWHCSYSGSLADGKVDGLSSNFRFQDHPDDELNEDTGPNHRSSPASCGPAILEDSLYIKNNHSEGLHVSERQIKGKRRINYYKSSLLDQRVQQVEKANGSCHSLQRYEGISVRGRDFV